MSTNFDYLKQNELYKEFSGQAIEAEKSLLVSASTCAILARRALELAVRWMFSYDNELQLPYRDNISSLIHEQSFKDIIEPRLFPMIKYIIKLGNIAVHTNSKIKRDDAILSLRNLFEFCDWVDYSYSKEYEDKIFDEKLLATGKEVHRKPEELRELYENLSSKDRKLEEVRKENEALREQVSRARHDNVQVRAFRVDELTEEETRKKYIDIDIMEAGWTIGVDCMEEVPVSGMPNTTGTGRADYVLFGKNHLPLAVIEAKKPSVNVKIGSHQAKLYADCLENQYGQRPLIFITNGFELYYINDAVGYASRRVSGIFNQEEMQLEIDRRTQRIPLEQIKIKDEITNRPYQKEAVLAVCDAIQKNHRKMLIVQATGSGKTRVSISIVDVLRRHNYVKNILFLADRVALVKQAKKNYSNLLPDLTLCNLLDNKDDPEQSRMIFSTYATMMNAIDDTKNKMGGKLFTPAHFDLIIVDESHRSIYKKYQEIFHYFDAFLLGMTATPKDEIDKNTYGVFELERGVPTFAYELEAAVEEGYLVSYNTLEYRSKIMDEGIHYKELTEEDKEQFEETFEADESINEDISSSAINTWLFNEDTMNHVLKELIKKGIKVEGGDKLGKTIIFAKNSKHAEKIVEQFQRLFPEYGPDFIKQIDYSIKYADNLIDDFSTKEKLPQIAVSVDMLDTGIDIPEILNLVFFKKVRSYSKFWQMIGRGTRLCPDLFGAGIDKERFLIFDFCHNFEYFEANPGGEESGIQPALSEKIFNLKAMIARELQAHPYQEGEDYVKYRTILVDEMHQMVMELNDNSFRVKEQLRYVETYRNKIMWNKLETTEITDIKEHISPLIVPKKEDELARRFDYLIYSINLGLLQSKNINQPMTVVIQSAKALSHLYTIPQVKLQKSVIEKVLSEEFWENANILEMDIVRGALRDLIQYIEVKEQKKYYTNFSDQITLEKEGEAIYGPSNLQNYKKKVEFYLQEHKDLLAVIKLRNNKKLSEGDLKELERVLWQELGSKNDYEKEYGDTPIGRLVRKIVGVDREALNEAFREFLIEERLNLNQMRFVRLIIDYIVANGNIDDNKILQEEPFKSVGSIVTLFKDDMATASRIMEVVADIKKNSEEIA